MTEKQKMTTAFKKFFKEIDQLELTYGEHAVIDALKSAAPGLGSAKTDAGALEEQITEGLVGAAIKAGLKAAGKTGKAAGTAGLGAAGWAAGKLSKIAGGALGLAGTAAAFTAGKSIDQDVNLADISTNKSLNVGGPLLQQTNDLLQQLTRALTQTQGVLASQLDDLDVSVDTATAAATGMTTDQVDAAQEAGADVAAMKKKKDKNTPKPARTPKPDKK